MTGQILTDWREIETGVLVIGGGGRKGTSDPGKGLQIG